MKMWKSLNNNIRNVDTLSKFKSELKKIDKTENHAIPKHYLGTEHLTRREGISEDHIRERPFNLKRGGVCFFSKISILIPNVAEKNILILAM
jgi:hypothetical protein